LLTARLLSHPRVRLFLIIAFVLFSIFLCQRISRLDADLFPYNSLPAAKGLALYMIGNYDGAAKAYEEHYRHTSQYVPTDLEYYALLQGDYDKARQLAENNLKANPSAVQSLLTLGEIEILENSFEAALKRFARVLEIQTGQADALLLSSVAHARLRDDGTAIHELNQTLRNEGLHTRVTSFFRLLEIIGALERSNSPQRPLCLLAHYHRYLRIFDPDQGNIAIAFANEAIRIGDHADDAYLTLGIIYTKQLNTEKVLEAFNNAVRINPKNAEALRWTSRIYRRRGDVLLEYKFIKAAYEAAPDDPVYFNALSEVLTERLGDFQQALPLNLKWVERNPKSPDVLTRLGSVYFDLGDYRNALEEYRMATLADPKYYLGFVGMGVSYRELEEWDKAAAAYRKGIDLRPLAPEVHIGLAAVYQLQKRYREAIAEYEAGFRLGERNPDHLKSLCGMYFQISEFEKQVRCLERVLEIQPNDAYARHELAFARRNLKP
jgi:tetratricopeptide (TPR) repeat protein